MNKKSKPQKKNKKIPYKPQVYYIKKGKYSGEFTLKDPYYSTVLTKEEYDKAVQEYYTTEDYINGDKSIQSLKYNVEMKAFVEYGDCLSAWGKYYKLRGDYEELKSALETVFNFVIRDEEEED